MEGLAEEFLEWVNSVAEVPELPGCMAHGSTKAAAIQNAEKAIALWVRTAQEDGLSVPEPRGKLMYA